MSGFWKVVKEKWHVILLEILQKDFLSEKAQCKLIVQKQGYQIQHLKNLFLRFKH